MIRQIYVAIYRTTRSNHPEELASSTDRLFFISIPFYSLSWGLMFQLMPSMRCAVNLLHHPWADACERMREKCGGEMRGTVYRAGSLRNFRSAVAAAIVWQCNICWWIDVNYVDTGLLNKLTNHWIQQNSGNFLTKSEIVRFSRMILV